MELTESDVTTSMTAGVQGFTKPADLHVQCCKLAGAVNEKAGYTEIPKSDMEHQDQI